MVLGHLELSVPCASIGQHEGLGSLGFRAAKTARSLLESLLTLLSP